MSQTTPIKAVQSAEEFERRVEDLLPSRLAEQMLGHETVHYRCEARDLIRERDAAIRRVVAEEYAAEQRVLLEVEKAAREFMPFFQPSYQGVPLANLRHALEAYETFKYSLKGL